MGHLAAQYATAMGEFFSFLLVKQSTRPCKAHFSLFSFLSPSGYRVIAIDKGADKRALLAGYGVEDFIDYTEGVRSSSLILLPFPFFPDPDLVPDLDLTGRRQGRSSAHRWTWSSRVDRRSFWGTSVRAGFVPFLFPFASL